MKVRFSIQGPDKKGKKRNRRFILYRDVVFESFDRDVPINSKTRQPKKREQKPFHCEPMDALNLRYLAKTIDENEALRQIKEIIIPELKRTEGANVRKRILNEKMFCEDNIKIFNKFFQKHYEENEGHDEELEESSVRTAKFEFMRALKLIDPHPLTTVEKSTLRSHWKHAIDSEDLSRNAVRKYGTRINQLLKAANRDFKLLLPKREKPEDIKHLTMDEFMNVFIPTIQKNNDKVTELLAKVLFGGGFRIGEAFVFNDPDEDISKNHLVHVSKQMTPKLKIKKLKNDRKHNTTILPEFIDDFREWCSIANKSVLRNSIQKKISAYAKEAFPNKPKKWITAHSLRHSFSIHLLGVHGLSISDVAMLLGDTEQVVKDFYVGNKVTDPQADRIINVLNSFSKKSKAS